MPMEDPDPRNEEYHVCPDCGYKQKSQARTKVRCHRCDRSYSPSDAKKADKTPDEEFGLGFATFSRS